MQVYAEDLGFVCNECILPEVDCNRCSYQCAVPCIKSNRIKLNYFVVYISKATVIGLWDLSFLSHMHRLSDRGTLVTGIQSSPLVLMISSQLPIRLFSLFKR